MFFRGSEFLNFAFIEEIHGENSSSENLKVSLFSEYKLRKHAL